MSETKKALDKLIAGALGSTKFVITAGTMLFSILVTVVLCILTWLNGGDWMNYLISALPAVFGNVVPAGIYTVVKGYQNTHGQNSPEVLIAKMQPMNLTLQTVQTAPAPPQEALTVPCDPLPTTQTGNIFNTEGKID